MAFNETINTGTTANDGQGDGLRTNIRKLIENDNYLKDLIENSNDLSPYNPDEEDITLSNNLLKLKDRANDNGMGYKRIRSDFNFSDIPEEYANSYWEIRHVHDLGGQNITIPENVILNFIGGSITNFGTITGNNTKIKSPLYKILDSSSVNGSWLLDEVFVEWFGALGVGFGDDSIAINTAIDFALKTYSSNVKFQGRVYSIEKPIKWKQTTNLIGKSISNGSVGGTTILCNFPQNIIENPPIDIYKNAYQVVLDYTPMIYNHEGVIIQQYIQDIRLDGNNLDVYGFYVNEIYYSNLDRFQITKCNKSPYTIIKSQFCQFKQLTMTDSSGDFRLINSASTVINGLDVEGISNLEDSWLKIIHDLNKTGITLLGLHYEELDGGTGNTQSDFITIGQRGVTILNPEIQVSGTGQERYVHLLTGNSVFNFDGISISSTNQANNCTISSDLVVDNIKIKLGIDATDFNVIGNLSMSNFYNLTGSGREKIGTLSFGRSFKILKDNGDNLLSFPSNEEMIYGNIKISSSFADRTIENTAGRLRFKASGANPDISVQTKQFQVYTSSGSSTQGDWKDGLFRLSGRYMWFNNEGILMQSHGNALPTSDLDGSTVASKHGIFIYSNLPDGTIGMTAVITDALSPSYRGVASGGGNEKALVFFDGNQWLYL